MFFPCCSGFNRIEILLEHLEIRIEFHVQAYYLTRQLSGSVLVPFADSCTIVLGMLSSGGNANPRNSIKIFWGIAMGASAGTLLVVGGLQALQTASIVGAFPFTIVMFFILYTTIKMLDHDFSEEVNRHHDQLDDCR